MKNILKIVTLLSLAACCFFLTTVHFKAEVNKTAETKTQGNVISISPSNQESQAVESRNLTSFFSALHYFKQKNQKEFSALLRACAFSKERNHGYYLFYAFCLIQRTESTDLIYPFHIFGK
jgi:hypothetical protein